MSQTNSNTEALRAARKEMALASVAIAENLRSISAKFDQARIVAEGDQPMSEEDLLGLGVTFENASVMVGELAELCQAVA